MSLFTETINLFSLGETVTPGQNSDAMLIVFYQAMARQDFPVTPWSLDHLRLISLSISSYSGHPEEAQNSDLRNI